MNIWYALWEALPIEMLHWQFMQNALLALLLLAPLFGLLSTMIVTGRMSFFSDALGHSAFTGIAIGCICGLAPTGVAVAFSVAFALLFSYVRSRSNQAADTLIGDVLSVTPAEIGVLAIVLAAVAVFWVLFGNRLILVSIHPQLASSRGLKVKATQTGFTVCIAVVVTLAINWVGLLMLNSLLVLPAASARNVSKNLRQYHGFSVLFALLASLLGLTISYHLGASTGAAISLCLAAIFSASFVFRKKVS